MMRGMLPLLVILAALALLRGTAEAAGAHVEEQEKCDNAKSRSGPDPEIADVVIVGAGFSGLGAAIELEKEGVSFVILEGQDQMGGRVRAKRDKLGGTTVEDGANWILGGEENPIFALAKKYGLEMVPARLYDDSVTYYPNGTKASSGVVRQSQEIFEAAKMCLFDFARALDHPLSYGSEMEDIGSRVVIEKCGWIPTNDIDYVVEWMGLDFGAASPDEISLQTIPDYSFLDFSPDHPFGDWYLVVDDRGYGYVADRLADELQSTSPILGANVTSIHWDNFNPHDEDHDPDNICSKSQPDYPVMVSGHNSRDGTAFKFCTKKVITTVSIGVLANRHDMFVPKMPSWKLDSNVYKMGVFEKVFYRFPIKFWGDEEVIRVAVPRESQGKCNVWYNLAKKEFKPESNILFCMITDDVVEDLGILQDNRLFLDDELLDEFLIPLRNIFNDSFVEPTSTYVPNWSNDEWTFGSWEKWQTGRSEEDFDEFTKPLVNKHGEKVVYLSGSATCKRYDGWVHGALLSGEQSAAEVMHDLGLPDIDLYSSDCDWHEAEKEDGTYHPLDYTIPWEVKEG